MKLSFILPIFVIFISIGIQESFEVESDQKGWNIEQLTGKYHDGESKKEDVFLIQYKLTSGNVSMSTFGSENFFVGFMFEVDTPYLASQTDTLEIKIPRNYPYTNSAGALGGIFVLVNGEEYPDALTLTDCFLHFSIPISGDSKIELAPTVLPSTIAFISETVPNHCLEKTILANEDLKLTIETDKKQYFDADLVYINWFVEPIHEEPYLDTSYFSCGNNAMLTLGSGSIEYRSHGLRPDQDWLSGLQNVCTSLTEMVSQGTIHPGQETENSFVWNQLISQIGTTEGIRPEPGFYNLKIGMSGVRACTEIQIVGDSPLPPKPKIPNDFKEIILGNTNDIPLKYHITGGELESADVYYDYGNKFLLFSLKPSTGGILILDISSQLIQKNSFSHYNQKYSIVVDGIGVYDDIQKIDNCNSDMLVIPFESDTKKVGIQGKTDDYSKMSNVDYHVPFAYPGCWWSDECQMPLTPDERIMPPRKQLASGIPLNEIQCNKGFEIIFKPSNNSPACVKPSTAEKLIERGWAQDVQNYPKNTEIISEYSNLPTNFEECANRGGYVSNTPSYVPGEGERCLFGVDSEQDPELYNQCTNAGGGLTVMEGSPPSYGCKIYYYESGSKCFGNFCD